MYKYINKYIVCLECNVYYPIGHVNVLNVKEYGMCRICYNTQEKKEKKKQYDREYKKGYVQKKIYKCIICNKIFNDKINKTYIIDFKKCRNCSLK